MAANDDDIGTVVALLLRAAAGDAWELPRALLELGVRLASAAVALAANNGASLPPLDGGGGGVFARHRWELVGGLAALGVLVAWAGLWVSGKPRARRAAGMAALYAAVVLFAVADGLRRGFAGNDDDRNAWSKT